MKKTLFATATLVTALSSAAIAEPAAGRWKTETGETGGYLHVDIAPCGAKLCGTIAKVVGNANTSIVGRQMITGMSPKGGGKYSGGKIWAPDVDKTYRSKMQLSGNTLKVSGCVGPICRSQNWTRLQ
ncbi:DUF2147 domain-containing protein [Aliishimia ponticola]|uniref:DUF2147 domain-containing protein n=1 Tax=Aliishimia ponticola TaxID=2499833 RepID=A0A4S4N925_9RHOB|nr:DUF2147 domain-containing protein [Aliishimia ponticola]THH35649.1 DUF2147 domain-containing protein [Aliishimia ponticola]